MLVFSKQMALVGRIVLFLAVGLLIFCTETVMAANQGKTAQQPSFPEFSHFKKAVLKHFKANPKYRENDIISRSDAETVFNKLKQMDWDVADRKEILKSVLGDSDYIVKELRSKKGRKFMRDISGLPGGYDRIDRFSYLPHGKKYLRELIKGPDGYKMFEYMTTTKGGKNLGKQLSNSPRGRNFNEPTGRIYTAGQLVDRLKKSHAEHLKALKKAAREKSAAKQPTAK